VASVKRRQALGGWSWPRLLLSAPVLRYASVCGLSQQPGSLHTSPKEVRCTPFSPLQPHHRRAASAGTESLTLSPLWRDSHGDDLPPCALVAVGGDGAGDDDLPLSHLLDVCLQRNGLAQRCGPQIGHLQMSSGAPDVRLCTYLSVFRLVGRGHRGAGRVAVDQGGYDAAVDHVLWPSSVIWLRFPRGDGFLARPVALDLQAMVVGLPTAPTVVVPSKPILDCWMIHYSLSPMRCFVPSISCHQAPLRPSRTPRAQLPPPCGIGSHTDRGKSLA